MTDEEREQIRQEAREEADLKAWITGIETKADAALAYTQMLDRYKVRLAWAIVLGAAALIFRPFLVIWDRVLATLGIGG